MIRCLHGDCRAVLPTLDAGSVQSVVTSPPYFGLRDYGVEGQIGLEPTPDEYVAQLVAVFADVRRVLRDDGTVFLNIGDSYASKPAGSNGLHDGRSNREERTSAGIPFGYKPKDLLGIPWRVAFALQADGWYLRSAIIWHKPNPMPESVRDRPTSAYEMVFLLTKRDRYFYDAEAIREPNCPVVQKSAERFHADPRVIEARKSGNIGTAPDRADSGKALRISNNAFANPAGRNARNVWTIATAPSQEAHFAMMPPELAERCIKAGSREGDTILDPFGGAGTTGLVADRLNRNAILIELNPANTDIATRRIVRDAPLFAEVSA